MEWHLGTAALGAGLGLLLGTLYTAALWSTVRRATASAHPARWLVLGAVTRLAVLFAVLAALAARGLPALLPAFAGFLVARVVLVRLFGDGRRTARGARGG